MRKFFCFTVLITLAFFTGDFQSTRAGQSQDVATEEKTVLHLTQTFHTAWNRGDAVEVAALFSPDGEFVSPSGAITSSRPEIRKLLAQEFQEKFHGTTLTISVDTIRFIKKDVALAKGTYKLQGVDVFLSLETSVNGSFIFRIRKPDGQWMIEQAYILNS